MTAAGLPLLLGFLAGYVSSVPIGPINLAVLARAVAGDARSALLIGGGACCVDLGFVAVGFLGVRHLPPLWVTLLFGAAGAAILLVGGVMCLRTRLRDMRFPESGGSTGAFAAAALGAVLCAGNPAFPVFWVSLLGWIHAHDVMTFGRWTQLVFMGGVACGNMAWFLTATRLGLALGRRAAGGLLRQGERVLGVVMIAAACVWVWDLVGTYITL